MVRTRVPVSDQKDSYESASLADEECSWDRVRVGSLTSEAFVQCQDQTLSHVVIRESSTSHLSCCS